MNKFETRRLNYLDLLELKCNGKAAQFFRDTGISASYAARMAYPEGKQGKKNIGDDTLEVIQSVYLIPPGIMDIKDGVKLFFKSKGGSNIHYLEPTDALKKSKKETVELLEYEDVRGGMGVGVILPDQPGQITRWTVTPEWIKKNIPTNTGANNLRIVTGFGNSMRGMFNSGDPLIVDIGVRRVEYDGVYFFRVADEGFIKILQRIPGEGILVMSKNTEYRDWYIKPDMDFQVFGRVLKVWKSEEL